MSFKKILTFLCCVILCIACAVCTACNTLPATPDNSGLPPSNNNTGNTGGEITDDNEVEVTEPDATEHDFTLISQVDGAYTYKCSDCNEEHTVVITYLSGTPNAYTVENNTVTFGNITEQSVYDISGTFHGNIVIDAGDTQKFELQTSGFEMYSRSACPVTILSGDKVTLSAKKSTENYIYDMREAVDETDTTAISASIYALCDLDILGKGSLSVKSVNNNGIHTKDDLNVKNLSLQVDCKDNALKGNDSVTVESGNIVLIARQGDGIKTTNSDISSKGKQRGTVAIMGGDILIYAACDGIDAAYDVKIDESAATINLQVFTDKYSKYSEEVTAVSEVAGYVLPNKGGLRPGGMGGHGGGMGMPGGGMDDGKTDKGDRSAKGIKADNSITVSAGTVTISSYDDGVHANNTAVLGNGETPTGNVSVTGGGLTLRSNDDGIHADGKVTVSGGSISVIGSYEGVEGNTIELSGGEVSVVSSDDGMNGTATSGTAITVSGGKLYVYANGDGVDSNSRASYSGIVFSGGKAIIISTSNGNSCIDTEQGYKFDGGCVVAIGPSGGMSNETVNCSNFSSVGTSKTLSLQKDGYLVVGDIVTVKMPVAINAFVVCLGKTNANISLSNSAGYDLDANGVYWNV